MAENVSAALTAVLAQVTALPAVRAVLAVQMIKTKQNLKNNSYFLL